MPYIVQSKREQLDDAIDNLMDQIRQIESDDPANDIGGCLNYIFTKMLLQSYRTNKYSELAQAVSVLEMCKQEYYRKHAAPYEDQKEFDNGVVE